MAQSLDIIYPLNVSGNSSQAPPVNDTSASDVIDMNDVLTSVLVAVVLCVIIFMTIFGNVLVIIAICINRNLRIPTNYFILNLAVADLLLGTAVLPFSATLEVIDYWAFGPYLCSIWAALDVLCCTASISSLCVISIDRYIGVTRPLQHPRIMSERRAVVIVVLVWLLATAISVAPLAGWKEKPPEDTTICEVTKQLGYVLFSVSVSFYVPLLIILVVYCRVYQEAARQSRFLTTGVKRAHPKSGITLRVHYGRNKNTTNGAAAATTAAIPLRDATTPVTSSTSSSSVSTRWRTAVKHTHAGKLAKFKREKKAAKTLGIVVGVFILCWFPFFFILPLGEYTYMYVD